MLEWVLEWILELGQVWVLELGRVWVLEIVQVWDMGTLALVLVSPAPVKGESEIGSQKLCPLQFFQALAEAHRLARSWSA